MVSFRFGETVVLHRRTLSGRDEYGNDTYTEDLEQLERIPAVPTSSREEDQGLATVSDQLTVLLPPNTEVASIDAITVYGDLYEVVGRPIRFISPFSGQNPGMPVTLKRVTG